MIRPTLEDEILAADFTPSAAMDLLVKSVLDMFKGFIQHLPNLVIAALALCLTWFLSWVAKKIYWRVVENRRIRRSLKDLFEKLIAIGIWTIGILAASVVLFPSVKPESILAGLGVSSVAIGFAFKDVIENFFAGFLILIREPLEIGDFVKCEDVEGKVDSITIRDTLIRQTDGQRVIVPNAMLFKNPVWIRTDQEVRRTSVVCGVAYDVDLSNAHDVIAESLTGLETVSKDKEIQVFACEFNSSSVDFQITWWTGSKPGELRRSRDEVIRAVKGALDREGIEIPFPYRTMTFKEPLRVETDSELVTTEAASESE